MSKSKKVKVLCQDCDGSGLLINQLCNKGTATICTTCGGNGFIEAEYIPFKEKKRIDGVEKVFQSAFGCPLFVSGIEEYELANNEKVSVNFDELDCSYEDWFNGNKSPILLKEFSCPFIASGQNPEIFQNYECKAEQRVPIGNWKCYADKERRMSCWDRYLKESKEDVE